VWGLLQRGPGGADRGGLKKETRGRGNRIGGSCRVDKVSFCDAATMGGYLGGALEEEGVKIFSELKLGKKRSVRKGEGQLCIFDRRGMAKGVGGEALLLQIEGSNFEKIMNEVGS